MVHKLPGFRMRAILKSLASPLPCGIGMYEKFIPDETWIEAGTRIMLNDEAKPALYLQFIEESLLDGFGEAGYAVCLPALLVARQNLSADPLTEPALHHALSDLLVGLRQALSQSQLPDSKRSAND